MEALAYIALFFVSYYYYRLAEKYQKNKWMFGLLGIALFALAYFLFAVMYGLFYADKIYEKNLEALGIKAFFAAIFFVFLIFQVLYYWLNKKIQQNSKEIDTIGTTED